MANAADDVLTPWTRHDPSITSVTQLRADLARGSLPQAFAEGARLHPESVLMVGDDAFTLADLQWRAQRWATALVNTGVVPGMPVMLQAPSTGAMVCAYLGLLQVGAPVVLVSTSQTAAEFATVAAKSGANLAIVDAVPHEGVRCVGLAELATTAETVDPYRGTSPNPDDVALIAFTSGTTGTPKGVPLTHAMLLSSIKAVMRAWKWSSDDRLVHALPLSHQHGLGGIHATLIAGSSCRLLSKFDPSALLAAVRAERASVLFAVPTVYQRLVDMPGEPAAELHSLRLATSGSAPLSAALFRGIQERLGITPVERYGLTESGLDVSNLYDGERRPGVVGYALPGVELRLADPAGRDVAVGEEGEIVLRGPQVFSGYLDDGAATEAAFHPDHWFRTGDLGRLESDGALRITGRLKDIIVTGGLNVSPREVEEVLATHPDVEQVAVAGVPDPQWGEAVAAWVVLRRPVDTDDLSRHCRTELASFKCPKVIRVVDALPRNAMGKIARNLLVR